MKLFAKTLIIICIFLFPVTGYTTGTLFLDVGVQANNHCAVTHFMVDVAGSLKLQPRFVVTTLEDAADEMKKGSFYVSAHGISNINSAAPDNALASKPYLYVRRGFTVLRESQFSSMEYLPEGVTVGVMRNSTAYQDIISNYPEDHFNLVVINQLEGHPRHQLRSGKFDAIAEGYTGFWFNPLDATDLTMIDVHPLLSEKPNAEGLVFWVDEQHPDVLVAINEKLKMINDNIFMHYQSNKKCQTNYKEFAE